MDLLSRLQQRIQWRRFGELWKIRIVPQKGGSGRNDLAMAPRRQGNLLTSDADVGWNQGLMSAGSRDLTA